MMEKFELIVTPLYRYFSPVKEVINHRDIAQIAAYMSIVCTKLFLLSSFSA